MTNTINPTGKIATYLRVSTTDQNLDRQEELREGADRVFEEKQSGADRHRPVLKELVEWVREGDLVRVWSIDRLARSQADLLDIVTQLRAKGCGIEFVTERLRFSPNGEDTPTDTLMFQIFGSFAEFERRVSRARQAEGIAKAKAQGKYKGRAPKIDAQVVKRARELEALGVSKAEIGRQLSLGRTSVYKALRGEVTKAA